MSVKQTVYYCVFYLLPFVIGAVWHFFSTWLAVPATLILTIMWFNAIAGLVQCEKERKAS